MVVVEGDKGVVGGGQNRGVMMVLGLGGYGRGNSFIMSNMTDLGTFARNARIW